MDVSVWCMIVQTKLICHYVKRLDLDESGYRPFDTYDWIKKQCEQHSPSSGWIFNIAFKKALKEQMIWEINGHYTTKRPKPRTIDDDWDW